MKRGDVILAPLSKLEATVLETIVSRIIGNLAMIEVDVALRHTLGL